MSDERTTKEEEGSEQRPWWSALVVFIVNHSDSVERIVCIFTMSVLLLHLLGVLPVKTPQPPTIVLP